MGFVSSSGSSGLILVAYLKTVRCRSTPYPASHRSWVDRCLPAFSALCCPAMLLISALDALRPSFEEKQCSRVRFVLPSSNLRHVVVPEPSCVWVPLCYLACCSTEFVGSCKMCNLVLLDFICKKKILAFLVAMLSPAVLLMEFLSSFIKNRVLLFLQKLPSLSSLRMGCSCSYLMALQ